MKQHKVKIGLNFIFNAREPVDHAIEFRTGGLHIADCSGKKHIGKLYAVICVNRQELP